MTNYSKYAPSSNSDDHELEVKKQIGRFAKAFVAGDADAMLKLWVPEPEQIVYQPEELGSAVLTHDGLRAYITRMPDIVVAQKDVRAIDFIVEVDDEIATVYSRFWARLVFRHLDAPIDGQLRQSFVLRRDNGKWLFKHYHESRQFPGFEAFEK